MIINFVSLCLVSLLQLSDEYPVDIRQPELESQKGARTFTAEKEPANSVPEEFYGEDVNLLKGETEDEESEGAQDVQEFSQHTSDTMRKINPLTIADQVSQMFRKGGQTSNLANKSGVGFRSPERGLRGQEVHVDQSLAMSTGPDSEESIIQPGYVRQGVPKIVNKPRSNDYGYSVIVLAGDAVHLPIKVQGKPVQGQGRSTLDGPVNVQNQGVYRPGEAEDKIGLEERPTKKEIRVYKQFGKAPEFPIYDEDFNFVPDPFHGILDKNYRIEVGKDSQKPILSSENFRTVDHGVSLHRVHIRSDKEAETGNVDSKKVACVSWGNSTESEVLSALNNNEINDGN